MSADPHACISVSGDVHKVNGPDRQSTPLPDAFTLSAARSTLLLVDFQVRLMPAIDRADAVLTEAHRLAQGAHLLGIPIHATEHNAARIGPTVDPLNACIQQRHAKMHFDATAERGFTDALPPHRDTLVVAGCEAHVCVLQTSLGLRRHGWRVALVIDAIGSRQPASREAALTRAAAHGIELVTTEMVLFEWVHTCEHPRFRDILALVR